MIRAGRLWGTLEKPVAMRCVLIIHTITDYVMCITIIRYNGAKWHAYSLLAGSIMQLLYL